MASNRFTDAELAAEYWSSAWDAYEAYENGHWTKPQPDPQEIVRQARIIERFAATPHYDESD